MKSREFRRLLLVGLVLAGLLSAVPAVFAAESGADRLRESGAAQIESLLQQYGDFNGATPVFTDYGDGFFSLSVELDPATRERLLAAVDEDGAADKRAPASLAFLAAGQSVSAPAAPSFCIHAALSNTMLPYNYWMVGVNLGNQSLARTASFKLTGPGLTFNRSFSVTLHANAFWAVWLIPGTGVGTPGFYTYTGTVSGLGSFVTHTFAANP
jgi:hypothetical protein